MHSWVVEDISSRSVKLAVVIMVWITWAYVGLPLVWEVMIESFFYGLMAFIG